MTFGNQEIPVHANTGGVLIASNKFIFVNQVNNMRKMVLTSNTGVQEKAGYSREDDWRNPDTWKMDSPVVKTYKVKNFRGDEGIYVYVL